MILIIQDKTFSEILVDVCLFIMVYMIHLHIRYINTSLITIRQSKDGFKNKNNYRKDVISDIGYSGKLCLIIYWV